MLDYVFKVLLGVLGSIINKLGGTMYDQLREEIIIYFDIE